VAVNTGLTVLMIDFVKNTFSFSENESRNETTSDLPKPHFVITGDADSFIQDTLEENQEVKVKVDHNQDVANDDNITEIFKVLKEHGDDITNLGIQQGYIFGKL
jgi:hypothetical protein